MKNPLNKEQKKAVEKSDTSMLIVAGAGTGKTRVLVEKIVYLIQNGVESKKILALTFTNKAGDEMRERIQEQTGGIPFVGTFHSFAVTLLREFGERIGVDRKFSIADADMTRRIIKRCMKQEDIRDIRPGVLQNLISILKTETALGYPTSSLDKNVLKAPAETILALYTDELKRENALDFDDLLIEAVRLLQSDNEVRSEMQRRYAYILVDEFQDTDDLQNIFVELVKGNNTFLVVVGDTDQTIYSWRGASVHNLLRFPERYDEVSTHILTENYRSTKSILEAANAVIKKNKLRQEKELDATRGTGERIKLFHSFNEEGEAELIANEIHHLHDSGIPYKEMAILFRANFQARALEMQMIRSGIPYTVLGARFFDRQEIKDLVSYIRLLQNPSSRESYERASGVPRRGIGKQTLEKLFSGQRNMLSSLQARKVKAFENDLTYIRSFATHHTLAETLTETMERLDYATYLKKNFENPEERGLQVAELIAFAKRFSHLSGEEAVTHFLSEISLGSDQDTLRTHTKKDAVRLMTIHAAKGLEFSCVFIAGMESGVLPIKQEGEDGEEERRLCYVAMTRAKDFLYCSFAKRRGIFGEYKTLLPSPFLSDIPKHTLHNHELLHDRSLLHSGEEKEIHID